MRRSIFMPDIRENEAKAVIRRHISSSQPIAETDPESLRGGDSSECARATAMRSRSSGYLHEIEEPYKRYGRRGEFAFRVIFTTDPSQEIEREKRQEGAGEIDEPCRFQTAAPCGSFIDDRSGNERGVGLTRRSTQSYKTGSKTSFKNVDVSNPPMTTIARGRCTSAPAPVAIAIGTNPRLATSAVIKIGRSRVSEPSNTASRTCLPCSRSWLK